MNFIKNILSLAPFLPLATACMDDATCGDPFHGKPAPNGFGASEARRILRGEKGKPSNIDPVLGTIRRWPALDDVLGTVYEKNFALRKIGKYIELWVTPDASFPDPSDCRNLLGLTEVTDAQLEEFAYQFDNVIYPALSGASGALSTPPEMNGKRGGGLYRGPWAALGIDPQVYGPAGLVDDYLKTYGTVRRNFQGNGDRIVVLVDNIRDKNYYEPTADDGKTFTAGFVSSFFMALTQRHVFTIDIFDWLHRTGANPPDGYTPDAPNDDYDSCAIALRRRDIFKSSPRGYEGVFAHEYTHLLSYYIASKDSWLEEGIADWAVTQVGYDDPTVELPSHLEAFLGFALQEEFGGPEQSLTQWIDQGAPEVLADYGAANLFILFLEARFGVDFVTTLHNDATAVSVSTFQDFLDANEPGTEFKDLLKEWQIALVTSNAVAVDGGTFSSPNGSYDSNKVGFSTVPISEINWDTPQAFSSPGAPTNGADFIRLRDGGGNPLSADVVSSIMFSGNGYPPLDMWTEEPTYLYSTKGDYLNTAIVRDVDITSGNIILRLAYDIELLYDFFIVQIYDETTNEWVSIGGDDTVDAGSGFKKYIPGLTGTSAGFPDTPVEIAYDASQFAGKTVKIALRYLTDAGVQNDGVLLYGMEVDGVDLDIGIVNWEPFVGAVEGWSVSIVSYTEGGPGEVIASELTLDSNSEADLDSSAVNALTGGSTGDLVAMIVSVIDTKGTKRGNAGYTLEVNGVAQGN